MTTPTAPLQVALVGYGYAGRTLHLPLIQATPGLALHTVVTSRPEEVRDSVPAVKAVPHPADAFADPAIALVVIATPDHTHAALAEAALLAGKHVVVDKPFTLSLADARRLAALAAERGLLLSVFQNRRWDSDFLGLQAMLADGRLGTLSHLESRFDRFRPVPRTQGGRLDRNVWLDLGPHLVDQALLLFGVPERVSGLIVRQREGAEADDWCQMQLDYGRLQVVLGASLLVAGGVPRFAAHGSGGSWIKYGLDAQENQLRAGLLPGAPDWGRDPRPGHLHLGGGRIEDHAVPPGDYRIYYAAVRDALVAQAPNPVTPAQAVATMAVLETGVEAARAGRMLELPLTAAEIAALAAPFFPPLV